MGNDSLEGLFPGAMLQVTSVNSEGEKHAGEFVCYLWGRKIDDAH